MPIQSGTWKPLPSKEVIQEGIEEQKRHNADLTSYLWYIIPVAEQFGEQVYDVAAESLTQNGVEVSAAQLKDLADELKTPEGMERYAEVRQLHVMGHVTG